MGRAALVGLVLWGVATLAFRLGGQYILPPDGGANVPALLILSLAVAGAAVLIARRLAQGGTATDAVALGLILPGMLLDAGAVLVFEQVFPNMGAGQADGFGALMLWGYGLIGGAIAIDGRMARGSRRTLA